MLREKKKTNITNCRTERGDFTTDSTAFKRIIRPTFVGSVVKNSPANSRETVCPLSRKIPRDSEQLSPCPTATEPVLQLTSPGAASTETCAPGACALRPEKPPQ